MQKILFLHRHSLDPRGRGGHHRSYQIFSDLQNKFGDAVSALSIESLTMKISPSGNRRINALSKRLKLATSALKRGYHPEKVLYDLLAQNGVAYKTFGEVQGKKYEEYIHKNGKPLVCIVDSPAFLPIIRFNKANGIKTVYCPQNIDSFDIWAHTLNSYPSRVKCSLHWLVEMEALATSDDRWMISELETNFIDGLGMPASHYPYLPVGVIRDRLLRIRASRGTNTDKINTFLMFGSMTHRTTCESFRWLLDNVQARGLPRGFQLQVAGRGGEKLAQDYPSIPNVQIRGLLTQDELDHLLTKTSLVLLPQRSGFGAVTRVSEMACAGIPVITSQHIMAAMNPPPGVTALPNAYDLWEKAIENNLDIVHKCSLNKYSAWEKQQNNPINDLLIS